MCLLLRSLAGFVFFILIFLFILIFDFFFPCFYVLIYLLLDRKVRRLSLLEPEFFPVYIPVLLNSFL